MVPTEFHPRRSGGLPSGWTSWPLRVMPAIPSRSGPCLRPAPPAHAAVPSVVRLIAWSKAAAVLHAQELQARARVSQTSGLLASLQEQERAWSCSGDQAQRAASAAAASSVRRPGYPSDFTKLPPPRNSSEAVQRVVQFALAQVGKTIRVGSPGAGQFRLQRVDASGVGPGGRADDPLLGLAVPGDDSVSLNDLPARRSAVLPIRSSNTWGCISATASWCRQRIRRRASS